MDFVCLQETKIQDMSSACAQSFGVGRLSDWKVVEAKGVARVIFFVLG